MKVNTMQGLYLVTPNWDDTQRLLTVTEKALGALDGGVCLLQYRHKTASASLRLAQAQALQSLCRAYRVPFIINDFIELCLQIDADGVHVGGTDASVAETHALVGDKKIVGASCYGDFSLAQQAQEAGASYVAFGGFYPSVVKQYPVTTQADIVNRAKSELRVPQVVIGGMTVDLARPLIARGANMVAVISSVFNADNPAEVVREFQSLFSERK